MNKQKSLENKIEKLSHRIEYLDNLSKKFSYFRLLIILTGVGLSLIMFISKIEVPSYFVFAVTIAVFLVVSHYHSKIDTGARRLKTWLNIQKTHLARLNIDWDSIPKITLPDDIIIDPIETDLNISGSKSLLQLISTSVSKEGLLLLRQWLLEKNIDVRAIKDRQKLIAELIPLDMFRDKLILLSQAFSKNHASPETLLKWVSSTLPINKIKLYIYGLSILLVFVYLLMGINFIFGLTTYWGYLILVYLAVYYSGNSILKDLLDESALLEKEFGRLSGVFLYLEKYKTSKLPYLTRLLSPFHKHHESPSSILKQLSFTAKTLQMRGNGFVWLLFTVIFPIDYILAYRLNTLKRKIHNNLEEWLNVCRKLDAVSSLANFASLNAQYSFPEISEETDAPIFITEDVGHPLIPKCQNIKNNFAVTELGKVFIITGSNMSGKSTFLRTIAMNQALAFAGSVVDAKYLKISPFRIFTCINVSDSVIDGISYFYAEVKRLKLLLDEVKRESPTPVFFFIDEIFKGTNNLERLTGSKAFIKSVTGANAIGMISTHDLDLIKLADENKSIQNFHFREEVIEDRMTFDYVLHDGPCPTTNALKIMKLEGLPVE